MNQGARRILIFSLYYFPLNVGGAEIAVKEITDRIDPSEIEFDMVTLRNKEVPAFEKVGNINVHRVGGNSKISQLSYIVIAALKAVSLDKSRKYDAVWPIMASYAGFAAILWRMFSSRARKLPFLLTIQEGEKFERREGVLKPFFKMIFKSATRIQTISNFLLKWSRQMGATCPIEVVPNGVNFAHFSNEASVAEREAIRGELGFGEDDKVMVTVSRLVNKNAVDDIVASLEYLDPSYKVLVIGNGEDEMELKDLALKLKVAHRTVFKGFVPHGELPKYIQASDIFVRPSRTEGFGNSFIEAMAAGVPVIATAVGGIPDFLVEGETGLFAEINNPRSIARKAEKYMKDKESRDYIVGRAKQMAGERYDWRGIAAAMKSFLMSC